MHPTEAMCLAPLPEGVTSEFVCALTHDNLRSAPMPDWHLRAASQRLAAAQTPASTDRFGSIAAVQLDGRWIGKRSRSLAATSENADASGGYRQQRIKLGLPIVSAAGNILSS